MGIGFGASTQKCEQHYNGGISFDKGYEISFGIYVGVSIRNTFWGEF